MLIPPPLIAASFAAGMWLVDRVSNLDFDVPSKVWVVGGIAAIGLAVDVLSILAFRKARTTVNPLDPARTSALVTTGPYRFSRNPMYVGLSLILTAWFVWLGDPLNLLLIGGFLVTVTALQIKPEERALTARFPDAFPAYAARTRRWI